MQKVRLGISVGDINGVGLELIIKSFQDLSLFKYCNPILYCCKNLVFFYAHLQEMTYLLMSRYVNKEETLQIKFGILTD